jgi:hypothetical protein
VRVGLDFDNTLAEYDHLFSALAVETELFDHSPGSKKQVRDQLRARPNGEYLWRRLQAMAYGPRLEEARMFDGVSDFLTACHDSKIEVVIVSHKTRFAACKEFKTDMRQAALDWMYGKGFFSKTGFGIKRENVHFADSRFEKVRMISELDCDYFVDDLEEVFIEPGFPVATRKVLFAPGQTETNIPVTLCRHWKEIADVIISQPVFA